VTRWEFSKFLLT